ncbi:MAG TPA: XdhC/CoxI family protein [Anaeromyxobacteraceae bacterium]|nr:XdhC/CoxI family protein [Anaeromyxobacteraceae bacterium]
MLRQAAAWADAGLGVALATVVSTWGSSPRPVGSQLAVNERGEFTGSVSGGCIEGAVVSESLAALRDGAPRRLAYGVSDGRAWEVGLACGGRIEVFTQRSRREVVGAVLEATGAKRAAVLITDLATGEARLVPADATGEDPELAAAVREAARLDRSTPLERAGRTLFLRVYNPPVRVVVVGAVHVAQPLVRMIRLAGYEAIVIDPRTAFATPERFPDVPLAPGWPEEALARLAPDQRTAVVALSHDPKLDDPAIAAALRSPAFYVGALGSRKTQAARRERLLAQGFGEADLARIHGPVGLPLGAVSPGEVAASILAELVLALRRPGAPPAVA